MKKRILAVVTAAILAIGCFATVSAKTPSETSDAAWKNIADGKVPGFTTYEKKAAKAISEGKIFDVSNSVDFQNTGDADYKIREFSTAFDGDQLKVYASLAHLYRQAGTEKVIRAFNLIADDADADNPIAVTVVDTSISASKKYALRHMNNTGEWDNTSGKVTSVANGIVKATVTKASPYALVELKGSAAPAADDTTATKNATGTKTAPKTGEV